MRYTGEEDYEVCVCGHLEDEHKRPISRGVLRSWQHCGRFESQRRREEIEWHKLKKLYTDYWEYERKMNVEAHQQDKQPVEG